MILNLGVTCCVSYSSLQTALVYYSTEHARTHKRMMKTEITQRDGVQGSFICASGGFGPFHSVRLLAKIKEPGQPAGEMRVDDGPQALGGFYG